MTSLDDIRRAAELQRGVVQRTPIERSDYLSDLAGRPVLLKMEHLQRAGSFKIRGAYVRMARLTDAEKARGVVAASAGNHAQGVALAARLLGINAVVHMPADAALPKVAATRGYGATVRLSGTSVDEAITKASAEADETGRVLIHPFDHPDIVAGQGTLGLEILEQAPDVGTIVVPTGGGGLLAGVISAVQSQRPDVQVVGVQAAGAAAYPASIAAGHPVPLERMRTMADGIAVGRPGDVPLSIIAQHAAEIVTVSEVSLLRALLGLIERAKQVVEPSGAAGVAALLEERITFRDELPIVVVLTGGNIDPILMLRMIQHGLTSAGRYLQVSVRIGDHPGSLAALLVELAGSGANVLSIAHVRTAIDLGLDEVEIDVELETKGPEHCAAVVSRLDSAGYTVTAR